jgi:hypothetical protein
VLIFLTAVIWVAASFISQLLVNTEEGKPSYNVSPFLLTYLSTSIFTIFLPLVQLKNLLQEMRLLRCVDAALCLSRPREEQQACSCVCALADEEPSNQPGHTISMYVATGMAQLHPELNAVRCCSWHCTCQTLLLHQLLHMCRRRSFKYKPLQQQDAADAEDEQLPLASAAAQQQQQHGRQQQQQTAAAAAATAAPGSLEADLDLAEAAAAAEQASAAARASAEAHKESFLAAAQVRACFRCNSCRCHKCCLMCCGTPSCSAVAIIESPAAGQCRPATQLHSCKRLAASSVGSVCCAPIIRAPQSTAPTLRTSHQHAQHWMSTLLLPLLLLPLQCLQCFMFWFIAQYLFNVSLSLTSVTSNTILSSSSSLFTFALSMLVLKEPYTCAKLLSIAACMGGAQDAAGCSRMQQVAAGCSDSDSPRVFEPPTQWVRCCSRCSVGFIMMGRLAGNAGCHDMQHLQQPASLQQK